MFFVQILFLIKKIFFTLLLFLGFFFLIQKYDFILFKKYIYLHKNKFLIVSPLSILCLVYVSSNAIIQQLFLSQSKYRLSKEVVQEPHERPTFPNVSLSGPCEADIFHWLNSLRTFVNLTTSPCESNDTDCLRLQASTMFAAYRECFTRSCIK